MGTESYGNVAEGPSDGIMRQGIQDLLMLAERIFSAEQMLNRGMMGLRGYPPPSPSQGQTASGNFGETKAERPSILDLMRGLHTQLSATTERLEEQAKELISLTK